MSLTKLEAISAKREKDRWQQSQISAAREKELTVEIERLRVVADSRAVIIETLQRRLAFEGPQNKWQATKVERLNAQITMLVAKEIQMQARLEALVEKFDTSAAIDYPCGGVFKQCARDLSSLLTLTK